MSVLRWLGSVVVGRRTCDREVAGSTPAVALFRQQPWASCSNLMCLCLFLLLLLLLLSVSD